MDRLALGLALTDEIEELSGHDRAGILGGLAATLRDNISCTIGPLDALITR